MSAWVAAGLALEVVAGPCLVAGVRLGALTSSAPDRFSAPLPPLRPLALYALGGGLAVGGLTSLREDLGWAGVALAVAVLVVCAGVVRVAWPRGWAATGQGAAARRALPALGEPERLRGARRAITRDGRPPLAGSAVAAGRRSR